jgi:hypothetical protein
MTISDKIIKCIQYKYFGSVTLIMTSDIYQTISTRDNWTFKKLNENIKYQNQTFWKNNVQSYK